MTEPKRKRGRPARTKQDPPHFYPGCGQMVRVRDGVVVPCPCKSCKVAFDTLQPADPMNLKFVKALGFSGANEATAWNDVQGRTMVEVLARLDAAIEGRI